MQRDYRRRYRIDALRSLRSFDDGVSDDSLKVQSVFVQKKSAGRFDGNVEGIRERERERFHWSPWKSTDCTSREFGHSPEQLLKWRLIIMKPYTSFDCHML